jgi:hypothetical protein
VELCLDVKEKLPPGTFPFCLETWQLSFHVKRMIRCMAWLRMAGCPSDPGDSWSTTLAGGRSLESLWPAEDLNSVNTARQEKGRSRRSGWSDSDTRRSSAAGGGALRVAGFRLLAAAGLLLLLLLKAEVCRSGRGPEEEGQLRRPDVVGWATAGAAGSARRGGQRQVTLGQVSLCIRIHSVLHLSWCIISRVKGQGTGARPYSQAVPTAISPGALGRRVKR